MTTHSDAFQDRMHDNFCFGCGADNPDGLQLKSAWDTVDPEVAVAEWMPGPVHAAGPPHILNGGRPATPPGRPGRRPGGGPAARPQGRGGGAPPPPRGP